MKPIVLLAATLVSSVLAGCVPPPSTTTHVSKLPDTGSPALHAVSDAKLRELMDRMNSVMLDRFLTQPEIDKERGRYAQKMVEAARRLDSTVHFILARLPALQLNDAEQTTFRALANKLHEQAQLLQHQAPQAHGEDITATLDQIANTCTSCHALFRKLTP